MVQSFFINELCYAIASPLECEISCFKGDISDFSYTNKQN